MEDAEKKRRAIRMAAFPLQVILALLLGGFSAFVGWNKAFAPLEILREHSAWTIHLPVLLGRLVGWLEVASVAVLFASLPFARFARFGMWAAIWITLNHMAAALVHVFHGEWSSLPANGIYLAMCFILVALTWYRTRASN